jgi:hypothetical protein
LAQFDSIWLNLTQFDSIWLNLTQLDSIWLNLTEFDSNHWLCCEAMQILKNFSGVIDTAVTCTAQSMTPLWLQSRFFRRILIHAQQSHWLRCDVHSGVIDSAVGCPRNKQTKYFGSNRNKPKHNLFRLIFGLFRETKNLFFRFVSVFRIRFKTTETNRSVSKQTEINKKKWKICWKEENLIMYFKLCRNTIRQEGNTQCCGADFVTLCGSLLPCCDTVSL